MATKSVSVVIPTYNRSRRVIRAMKSVQNQCHEEITTVVVIDGSMDGTIASLQEFRSRLSRGRRQRLEILQQENRGVSSARNAGIRSSDSEFIALLDDDDLWHHEKLTRQLIELRKYSTRDTVLCTTNFVELHIAGGESDSIDCSECMSLSGQIRLGMFPPPSSWLFSREAFEAVGGFDEALHAGEDADFVTRLRRLGATFRNVCEPLTFYTVAPEGKIYRDQELSASRTLLKHDAWWRSVLDAEEYDKVLSWYRNVLPERLYRETRALLDLHGN